MPPHFGPVASPVSPPLQWVIPALFQEADAHAEVKERATRGAHRAADAAARVRTTRAEALWVPFWRTEVEVDGWMLEHYEWEPSHSDWPRHPHRTHHGIRFDSVDAKRVLSVCARRDFGLEGGARRRGRLLGSPVKIPPSSARPWADLPESTRSQARVIEADVDWPEAEAWARDAAKHASERSSTIISKTKTTTQAMQFVWVPVWWVDYDYDGVANPNGDTGFAVVLAVHDGTPLLEKHPSRIRAMASRARGLISLDRGALAGTWLENVGKRR